MLNSYLIKGERPSLSSRYIANQSGSAKETVSPKIGENIEMLVCFLCMGTQDRTLIDINHHYQITMNQILNINIYKVTFSAAYLIFLDKEIAKKKSFYPRVTRDYFSFHPAGG